VFQSDFVDAFEGARRSRRGAGVPEQAGRGSAAGRPRPSSPSSSPRAGGAGRDVDRRQSSTPSRATPRRATSSSRESNGGFDGVHDKLLDALGDRGK
jgi:hypothetical protein